MLRGIHNASRNWLGRGVMVVVLGLIIVSFAIWGVGDMFRGFRQNTVAKIGDVEIGIEQFRQQFNERVQQLSRQLQRVVTPAQARALGLDRQLLGELVAQAALDTRVRQLGLGLPDSAVAARITNDPTFKGINGQFDRARFEQLIRQAGYTEQRFVNEQRNVMLRQQIAEALAGGLNTPHSEITALNRYRDEQRSIEYVTLGEAQAGTIPAPSPEELTKYFNEHKAEFRAPEYRKVVILPVLPENLATWTTVSDADAKALYDREKSRFSTPERRTLQQMVFPDPASAQAAEQRIQQGTPFATVAKERGLKESEINLGTLSKSEMVDAKVAAAAFALQKGQTSAPIQGQFGTVLVNVIDIQPATNQTYEQVAPMLKKQLALERAKTQAQDLFDKIEDARASGMTLAEVGQKLKLPVTTVEVDRSGRGPDGQPVTGLPKGVDVVSAAFRTDVGVENDPLQANGNYVWYDVAAIVPSRERKLEEVKDQVEAAWRSAEIRSRLTKQAEDMVAKLKAGTPMAQVATNGLQVQTASGLKRGQSDAPVPKSVLNATFRTPKGGSGSAPGAEPNSQVVFVVQDITEPKLDAAAFEIKQMTDRLKQSRSDDLLSEYVAYLENEIGSSVNQSALAQATGANTGTN